MYKSKINLLSSIGVDPGVEGSRAPDFGVGVMGSP